MFDSQVLKSLGSATIALSKAIITTAGKTEEVVNHLGNAAVHTSAMLDDLAADGHDATTMAGAYNALERRRKYRDKYKEAEFQLPKELAASTAA